MDINPNSAYVIYDTEDYHIIDTAEDAVTANMRCWWRVSAAMATRENYEKIVAENVVEVP
jgi:hypothetical protein